MKDAFWSKVDIKSEDECWEWNRGKDSKGYGQLQYKGTKCTASRMAWILANNVDYSSLRSEDFVLHKCDNPSCCNPKHLYLGNAKDNMRDRCERNPTSPKIFGSNKAKLCDVEIKIIREMELSGKYTQIYIAEIFEVSRTTISRIWKSNKFLCKEGYYV